MIRAMARVENKATHGYSSSISSVPQISLALPRTLPEHASVRAGGYCEFYKAMCPGSLQCRLSRLRSMP
jgi:hypothetical protein